MLFLFALLAQTLLASGTPDGKYAEIVQGIRKLNNTYKNFSQVLSLGNNFTRPSQLEMIGSF